MPSGSQRFIRHVQGIVLTQEYDLGFGRDLAYLPRSLDSAYSREADVQQHEVWLKFVGFLDCIFAGCCFANYIQRRVVRKETAN